MLHLQLDNKTAAHCTTCDSSSISSSSESVPCRLIQSKSAYRDYEHDDEDDNDPIDYGMIDDDDNEFD
ncbi:hypothetical protein Tco_1237104 [Tanacetum coccineum]